MPRKVKILIFLFDIFSVRNFLYTPLWNELQNQHNAEFIFVTDSESHKKYIEEQKTENIRYYSKETANETFSFFIRSFFRKPSFSKLSKITGRLLERIVNKIHFELFVRILYRFNHIHKFNTHRLKLHLPPSERYKKFGEFKYLGFPFSNSKALLGLLYRLFSARWWHVPSWLGKLFAEEMPDHVVVAFPQNMAGFMVDRAARRFGVPQTAYVNSWDQPTTKGPFPPGITRFMVWNEQMRGELEQYHNIAKERVAVVGAAQLDLYTQEGMILPEEEFRAGIGIPLDRKLMVYGAYGNRLGPDEPDVALHLAKRVSEDAYSRPVALVIRPHPKDGDWRQRFGGLEQYKNVHVRQSSNYGNADTDRSLSDLRELTNFMRYASVVFNANGTLTLDSIFFDTPVVNIGFDGNRTLEGMQSIYHRFNFNHFKPIIDLKGSRLVRNYAELDEAVNSYLSDPALDSDNRLRVRQRLLEPSDGQSGRRIAEYILNAALAGKEKDLSQ